MNLLDLKLSVDKAIQSSANPERVSVVFATSDTYFGAIPTVAINSVGLGFDFDSNKFLLFSNEEVYKAKKVKSND